MNWPTIIKNILLRFSTDWFNSSLRGSRLGSLLGFCEGSARIQQGSSKDSLHLMLILSDFFWQLIPEEIECCMEQRLGLLVDLSQVLWGCLAVVPWDEFRNDCDRRKNKLLGHRQCLKRWQQRRQTKAIRTTTGSLESLSQQRNYKSSGTENAILNDVGRSCGTFAGSVLVSKPWQQKSTEIPHRFIYFVLLFFRSSLSLLDQ